MDYVSAAVKLAKLEWNRAKEGLVAFETDFGAKDRSEGTVKKTDVPGTSDILRKLLEHIERNNRTDSVKLLDELMAAETDGSTVSKLEEAKKYISEIEFEEAQKIIAGMIE